MKRKDFNMILRQLKNTFNSNEPVSYCDDYYGEKKVTLIIKTKEMISKEDEKYSCLFSLMEESYYLSIKSEGDSISIKLKIKLESSVD